MRPFPPGAAVCRSSARSARPTGRRKDRRQVERPGQWALGPPLAGLSVRYRAGTRIVRAWSHGCCQPARSSNPSSQMGGQAPDQVAADLETRPAISGRMVDQHPVRRIGQPADRDDRHRGDLARVRRPNGTPFAPPGDHGRHVEAAAPRRGPRAANREPRSRFGRPRSPPRPHAERCRRDRCRRRPSAPPGNAIWPAWVRIVAARSTNKISGPSGPAPIKISTAAARPPAPGRIATTRASRSSSGQRQHQRVQPAGSWARVAVTGRPPDAAWRGCGAGRRS